MHGLLNPGFCRTATSPGSAARTLAASPPSLSQPAPGLAQEQLTLRQFGVCSIPASFPGLPASLTAPRENTSVQCSRLPQPQQGASGCPGHASTVPQASQPGLTPVQIQSGEPLPRHPLSLSDWPMSQLIPSSSPSEMGQGPIASCPAAPCPTCPSSQRSISDCSPSP